MLETVEVYDPRLIERKCQRVSIRSGIEQFFFSRVGRVKLEGTSTELSKSEKIIRAYVGTG